MGNLNCTHPSENKETNFDLNVSLSAANEEATVAKAARPVKKTETPISNEDVDFITEAEFRRQIGSEIMEIVENNPVEDNCREEPFLKLDKPIKLSDSSRFYFGGFNEDGKYSGFGEIFFKEKGYYKGHFKNGLFEGKGIFVNLDFTYYKGDFHSSFTNGKGFFKGKGFTYEGEWVEDKFEGKGVMKKDEMVYEGHFKNGLKNGPCVITWDNGAKFEGEMKDEKYEGQGVYIWANDKQYEGLFHEGKFEGEGSLRSADGSVHCGSYRKDKKNGPGKLVCGNGEEIFGNWVDDKLEGKCMIKGEEGERSCIYRKGVRIYDQKYTVAQ